MTTNATTIAVANIEVLKDRFRLVSAERVKELAESIRDQGQLQPILVRQVSGSKYKLLDGEHRLEAIKLLGQTTIVAQVRARASAGSDQSKRGRKAHRKSARTNPDSWKQERAAERARENIDDQLIEIDANLTRSELTEGEYKLAVKRRKQLCEDRAKLSGQTERQAKRTATAEQAASLRKRLRTVQQVVKEATQMEDIAKWCGIDVRALAKSHICGRESLKAACEIIEKYGRGALPSGVAAHDLLKRHIHSATKGNSGISLVELKRWVDAELRETSRSEDENARRRHLAQLASKAAKALETFGEACRDYAKLGDAEKRTGLVRHRDRCLRLAQEFRQIASGQRAGPEVHMPRVQ